MALITTLLSFLGTGRAAHSKRTPQPWVAHAAVTQECLIMVSKDWLVANGGLM